MTTNSYALITGASRGIGKALATQLAEQKHNLILVARSEMELKSLAENLSKAHQVEVKYLIVDLAQTSAPKTIFDYCQTNQLAVSILINNAGYALWGSFEASSWTDQQVMLQVVLNSIVETCHLFIPELKKQPKAYLMNVSSSTQYQAVPYMATYAAAKGFILLFTRALKVELKNSSVNVSCLVPGTTDTGFIDRAGMSDSIRKKAKQVEMTPDAVAKIALAGMWKGKAEIIPGFINWFGAMATYFIPKALAETIAEGIYKPGK